jgi:hypothetical protein
MRILVTVLLLFLLAYSNAFAQNVGLQASAQLRPPFQAGNVNHLSFGTIIPGQSKEIMAISGDRSTPNEDAGTWELHRDPSSRDIFLALELPAVAEHDNGGTDAIPMSWDSEDYLALCEMTSSGCTNLVNVNPAAHQFPSAYHYSYSQNGSQNGSLRLFLGGKVEPTADQSSGSYTGTVTLRFFSPN